MKNPTKTVVVITLTLMATLLVLAPTVAAQTVIPGGIVHVGAQEIADAASGQAGYVASDPRAGAVLIAKRNLTPSVKDNTYAEACVKIEANEKIYSAGVPARKIPRKYFGGWNPDQEEYNPCPSSIYSSQSTNPTPPGNHHVINTQPANGDVGVSPTTLVKAEFSEAVNQNTLLLNFHLKDVNGTRVPASVSYNPQTYTATLDPEVELAEGAKYTAIIKGTVKNASGQNMAAEHVWSFTIGSCSESQVGVPGVTCAPPSQ